MWFHDGSSDECDILIEADGSYSKVKFKLNPLSFLSSFLTWEDIPICIQTAKARRRPLADAKI